jgi:hypothetical protein
MGTMGIVIAFSKIFEKQKRPPYQAKIGLPMK